MMPPSRPPSQNPPVFGRKRSNTVQSSLRSPASAVPLVVGNTKDLKLWVHDPINPSADVIFLPECWPGVLEGDMIRVTGIETGCDKGEDIWERDGFLFVVKREGDDAFRLAADTISISKNIAEAFKLRNYATVRLKKVDSIDMCTEYIEIVFKEQYLGRSDMWRLGKQLQNQCVYVGQEISFVGSPTGKIQNIYINGKNVSAGLVTNATKSIYRSLSAKVTIFIQVCRELWDFAGDGERYNEKIVHSFLPALFRRWSEAKTSHIITIVLISRVYYEDSEIDYAAGPLRKDDDNRWYKDFFKVITDLEVIEDWKPTLVSLKESFVAFQRDILLTHHYHSARQGVDASDVTEVRLVGRISYAHEGPILEALNLALNPMETHYVDRSLSLTGASTILITPGTGYYRVTKRLLRLTTRRLLDQGFGLDIVSLAKPPLHQTPIFSFKGTEPSPRQESVIKEYPRNGWGNNDPLWGGGDDLTDVAEGERATFWWDPFWIVISFWDQQMDLPFRQDRFVARARMPQIEMLGLLEHDVLSSIQVPYLPHFPDPKIVPMDEHPQDYSDARKLEADVFDEDRFTLTKKMPVHLGRESTSSSGITAIAEPSSLRLYNHDKRPSFITQRLSTIAPRIAPIEESPSRKYIDLPSDREKDGLTSGSQTILSTSPSNSIISRKSEDPPKEEESKSQEPAQSRPSLRSRLASSWLFDPFRSGSSANNNDAPADTSTETQNAPPASSSAARSATPSLHPPSSTALTVPQSRAPHPVNIRSTPSRRSTLSQASEDETATSSRSTTYVRSASLRHSPRDESVFAHRRSTVTSLSLTMSPVVRTNPLRSKEAIPYMQTSLASRWQHMFPQPLYKHQIKWKSMVTPGCLPLTTEYFPTNSELDTSYDVFSYEFVIDPPDMKSFLARDPTVGGESADDARKSWALVVMRGMTSLRLVQGFQIVVRPERLEKNDPNYDHYNVDDKRTPKPVGASEVFQTNDHPVFLSMSNEIHRISYNGEAIQVRRYVRRMPPAHPFSYKCLVWPKLGVGYTELSTSFGAINSDKSQSPNNSGLANYNWNRLDMLIAGYEHQFIESLHYWRTRFIVIPTLDAPPEIRGASGERLNDEETRLVGSDKLAEQFSKSRWMTTSDKEKGVVYPPVRFLPTYLNPTASVIDEHLVSQLEEIIASGPLGKNLKSERVLEGTSLQELAKMMRGDRGLTIKDHKWHTRMYEDSFTGADFATWLWREFQDVSTREQAQDWGKKLRERGLFEHCRGRHGFLDGHYFYRLRGEYAVPRTPKSGRGWGFRPVIRHVSVEEKDVPRVFYPGSTKVKPRKRLVLSQTLIIDVDPAKKSDQAEMVVLHHDLIHNPANVFHFELHWLGTTARCIEDQLRIWTTRIERYGLKLVETYVSQISDIRTRNPFQSCFPVHLSIDPPIVPDLEQRLTTSADTCGSATTPPVQYFFEYALLQRLGYILDIEATDLYPARVEVFYSYSRSKFTHSQFVHRTGVAFVQVQPKAFLFLTNRLMGPGRAGPREIRPAEAAEKLRIELNNFCKDEKRLIDFYNEVLADLPSVPEEPPPLSI